MTMALICPRTFSSFTSLVFRSNIFCLLYKYLSCPKAFSFYILTSGVSVLLFTLFLSSSVPVVLQQKGHARFSSFFFFSTVVPKTQKQRNKIEWRYHCRLPVLNSDCTHTNRIPARTVSERSPEHGARASDCRITRRLDLLRLRPRHRHWRVDGHGGCRQLQHVSHDF